MSDTTTPLIGTEDAALILGVDRSTITRRVQAGKMRPAHTLKNGYLFARGDVEQLAREGSSATSPRPDAAGVPDRGESR